ncbi:Hypothetical predicted protein [Octopus vulgaris]|uniref:Uncharacterized protein n=1 Tax=Octopus vulgaris TaxID=6645 RepID=A0AA36F061_OCTVU|nr:Hypothetical predicted protein [Octopus vulgaris]
MKSCIPRLTPRLLEDDPDRRSQFCEQFDIGYVKQVVGVLHICKRESVGLPAYRPPMRRRTWHYEITDNILKHEDVSRYQFPKLQDIAYVKQVVGVLHICKRETVGLPACRPPMRRRTWHYEITDNILKHEDVSRYQFPKLQAFTYQSRITGVTDSCRFRYHRVKLNIPSSKTAAPPKRPASGTRPSLRTSRLSTRSCEFNITINIAHTRKQSDKESKGDYAKPFELREISLV